MSYSAYSLKLVILTPASLTVWHCYLSASVRNVEVLLEGSLILRRNGAHARGSMCPDSGPTLDTLSLCQDDINLIVTCFNAVFQFLLE